MSRSRFGHNDNRNLSQNQQKHSLNSNDNGNQNPSMINYDIDIVGRSARLPIEKPEPPQKHKDIFCNINTSKQRSRSSYSVGHTSLEQMDASKSQSYIKTMQSKQEKRKPNDIFLTVMFDIPPCFGTFFIFFVLFCDLFVYTVIQYHIRISQTPNNKSRNGNSNEEQNDNYSMDKKCYDSDNSDDENDDDDSITIV